MDMVVGTSRVRPEYYFSGRDQEILEDHVLKISSDEETWLYRIGSSSVNGQFDQFHLASVSFNNSPKTPASSVDTRTFTRRKHCSMRPSLDSVVESPLSNRSSLGLLGASKLLNEPLGTPYSTPSLLDNLDKNSLSFTVSDKNPTRREFKLDSPFMNTSALGVPPTIYQRVRLDSESSDISVSQLKDSLGSFDKNVMTNSLVSFLENEEVKCRPPLAFQDNHRMTDSIISIPEKEVRGGVEEQMTDSLVNFLAPVNCNPPSGFGDDSSMTESLVNINENELPESGMTDSVMDFVSISVKPQAPLIESMASSESENIPPELCKKEQLDIENCDDEHLKQSKLNSTFNVENDTVFTQNNETFDMKETLTNNINVSKRRKDGGDATDELTMAKDHNNTFTKDSPQTRALHNRDLNVTRDMNREEVNDVGNSTFSKKQFPQRNSVFNTTFTQLNVQDSPPKGMNTTFNTPKNTSLKSLNTTFTRSMEVLEDDQMSSASDSSFSSGSTKPGSVDELRSIAQQQENSLSQTTSTPEQASKTADFAKFDLELSPIRRTPNGLGRNESRSANCSPVRSPHPVSMRPHPISRLRMPVTEVRRQPMQASSLSNIARQMPSGLRLPQPVSRIAAPQVPSVRPTTQPAAVRTLTSIPRPAASRLPMPRPRATGIPAPRKRH